MSSIPRIVGMARDGFRQCFKQKSVDCVTSLYHRRAVLKGTFSKKPVSGHENIKKYFVKLFRTVDDVKFDKEPIVFKRKDLYFVCGKYSFHLGNGEHIKATYQLVLDEGKILTHFSAVNETQ